MPSPYTGFISWAGSKAPQGSPAAVLVSAHFSHRPRGGKSIRRSRATAAFACAIHPSTRITLNIDDANCLEYNENHVFAVTQAALRFKNHLYFNILGHKFVTPRINENLSRDQRIGALLTTEFQRKFSGAKKPAIRPNRGLAGRSRIQAWGSAEDQLRCDIGDALAPSAVVIGGNRHAERAGPRPELGASHRWLAPVAGEE